MMGNIAFGVVVVLGGVLCGWIDRSYGWEPPLTPALVMLGAVILGAVLRAIMNRSFPKQLWGPGTIPRRGKPPGRQSRESSASID